MRALALLTAAICLSQPARAAETLAGAYALPSGEAKVSAALAAAPGPDGVLMLDVTMTALGQSRPLTRYDTELSKQMHVIAVADDFGSFVHEHGDRPDASGHFHVAMRLPRPGRYHVYADAAPAGLGQQVMRFDLDSGGQPGAASPAPSGFEGADGAYAARFDPFELRAGQESELRLHISRNGKPAPDVTPFLGVAAHAVFIDAADLTYVHVHAAPAEAPMHMPGMKGEKTPPMKSIGMDDMDMSHPALAPGARVPPDLALHVLAPKAGAYRLWVQFTAGGRVRTVPFAVDVR